VGLIASNPTTPRGAFGKIPRIISDHPMEQNMQTEAEIPKGHIVLSKDAAQILFAVYVEGDDLAGAALGTRLAVKELRDALGIKAQRGEA
jgi:hypothetical protein